MVNLFKDIRPMGKVEKKFQRTTEQEQRELKKKELLNKKFIKLTKKK